MPVMSGIFIPGGRSELTTARASIFIAQGNSVSLSLTTEQSANITYSVITEKKKSTNKLLLVDVDICIR
jgi:hypothetical protein